MVSENHPVSLHTKARITAGGPTCTHPPSGLLHLVVWTLPLRRGMPGTQSAAPDLRQQAEQFP